MSVQFFIIYPSIDRIRLVRKDGGRTERSVENVQEKETQPIHQSKSTKTSSMIHEALFPQEPIDEEAEPIVEASPITTYHITDLPQTDQDMLNNCKGHRNARYKRFILKNKGVVK